MLFNRVPLTSIDAAGRQAEQEARDVLPVLAGRVVLLPREGGVVANEIVTRLTARVRAELAVEPHVVARLHRVLPHHPRVGRLERVDRVRGVPGEVVADVGELSKSKCGKYCAPPNWPRTAGEKPSVAGSNSPSCWRTLGSLKRCQPPRTSSSDLELIV